MKKIILPIFLLHCCYLATAEDTQYPYLTSGFYSNVKDSYKYASKDTTLVNIDTNQNESTITLVSISSRNQFVSDGYGIDEVGGHFNQPVVFNQDDINHFTATSGSCNATLTQKSATSFSISTNTDEDCFGEYGLFASNGYVDRKMLTDYTFTLDTNRANIQALHGQ